MSHYKPYPSYKNSGVPWLGNVPSHWEIAPLWSVYHPIKRTGFTNEPLLSVYRDHGVVLKASRDDNRNRASDDLSPYQLVEPGHLVTNKMKTWQGSIAVSELRGIVSPAYFIYEPIRNVFGRFVHHLMRSRPYITGYMSVSKGIRVGQWDLDPDHFRIFPVLFPPKEEQERIVDVLDNETARIDALIAKKVEFIELLAKKRRALITNLVTKGLDPEAKMKDSGVEWIGKVPEHWAVKRFKFVVSASKNGTWGNDPNGVHDIQCVRVADFDRDVLATSSEIPTLRAVPSNERDGRLLRRGNLLLEKSGGGENQPVGQVVIYDRDEDAVCSNFIARIELVQDVPPAFWNYSFAAAYNARLNLRSIKQTSGIQNLDQEQYLSEYAAFPPVDEQAAIASKIDRESARIDTISANTRFSIDLLKKRRSALITAAVTGQIDLREFA